MTGVLDLIRNTDSGVCARGESVNPTSVLVFRFFSWNAVAVSVCFSFRTCCPCFVFESVIIQFTFSALFYGILPPDHITQKEVSVTIFIVLEKL